MADMTVGYKAIRETFTSQVVLRPDKNLIDVRYIDGPFRHLENRWTFEPTEDGGLPRAFPHATTSSRAASWVP